MSESASPGGPAGKLRAGVIGAGSWAVASHIPNLAKRSGDVELVGVSRLGGEHLSTISERWGFAVASEDYRDVLAEDLDICIVSSPTALHHEHAKAALESGAHVLVEKPVTIRPDDAWELVQTARRNDRHLVCAFGWNYRPMLREAKRLMDGRGVGMIETMTIRMASFTRELLSNRGAYPKASPETVPEQRTWTDPNISGGGYAQAQLSHALGVGLWLSGLRGSEVAARLAAPLDAPVELHVAAAIRYDGDAIGTLAGASSHVDAIGVSENELDIRIIGSDGQFALDIDAGLVWLGRRDGEERLELGHDAGLYDCDGPPNALVDLALGRPVENASPGELGARTVEILDALYRSAGSGRFEAVAGSPA
jgi:predicted dehydrogenase